MKYGWLGVFALLLLTDSVWAKQNCLKWSAGITNGALLVEKDGADLPICDFHSDQQFIPASLAKIPVSLVGIKKLGKDFHYTTHILTNARNDLIVQGTGDPFLTSEEIRNLAIMLRERGYLVFNRLLFDLSLYEDIEIPGAAASEQPYDALISPISVNFNTINIQRDLAGRVFSAESQTPTLPIMVNLGTNLLKPGQKDRFNLSRREDLLQYAHELLLNIFAEQQITFAHTELDFTNALADPASTPVLLLDYANSRNLLSDLSQTLQYSNNMQANNLLLQIGVQTYGFPANLDKGLAVVKEVLAKDYGFLPRELMLQEGSGLSPNNRATARGLMKALVAFQPYKELLTFKHGAWLKSGTLTGVYNFAGYIPVGSSLYRLVLMTNQSTNPRIGILQEIERDLISQ